MKIEVEFTDRAEAEFRRLTEASGMTPVEIIQAGITLFRIYANGRLSGKMKLAVIGDNNEPQEIWVQSRI